MTDYIYGSIQLGKPDDRSRERVAWEILRLGMERRIHFALGSNCGRSDLGDLLGSEWHYPNGFEILVTESPLSNVPPAVFDFIRLQHMKPEELRDLQSLIESIEAILFAVHRVEFVKAVRLAFGDQFDIDIPNYNVPRGRMWEVFWKAVGARGELAPFSLTLTFEDSSGA